MRLSSTHVHTQRDWLEAVTDLAARLLAALGVPEGVRDVPASQLVVLVDALLMYDTSHAEPVDLETTLTAYLRGMIG